MNSKILNVSLISCALFTSIGAYAQNLNLDKTLKTSTNKVMRFDDTDDNSVPFTWEELAFVPVQATAEIGASRLLRAYIRTLEYKKISKYVPDQAKVLDQANEDYAPLRKLYRSKGGRYRSLGEKYDRAENGYWVQDYRTVVGTGIGADGKVTTTFTSVPDGKHFVGPDHVKAARLKPLLENEEKKLGSLLTDYQSAKNSVENAQSAFDRASDRLLNVSGSQYATADGVALRSELLPLKIFRVATAVGEGYFIVNLVSQVGVIIDGRHPGLFPSIPLAKATPKALKDFFHVFTE